MPFSFGRGGGEESKANRRRLPQAGFHPRGLQVTNPFATARIRCAEKRLHIRVEPLRHSTLVISGCGRGNEAVPLARRVEIFPGDNAKVIDGGDERSGGAGHVERLELAL